jgi:SAM-dependent methyltransferase
MEAAAYRQFQELEERHWWFRGRRSVYLGLLDRHLAGERPARALDLGCGVGGFLPGLARLAGAVFPADLSREALVCCRERGFGRGVVCDGYALPYADGSFDLVCLFDAIEHIEDDARALREVARVLRPGGLLIASVPAYPLLYANNDRVARHRRRYTRRSLRAVLEQAQLAVERNTHANVFLFPLILPAVLALKLCEGLSARAARAQHTNLSWPLPRPLNRLCAALFAAELPFTKRFDWPAGHSILALARKAGRPAGRPLQPSRSEPPLAAPASSGSSGSSSRGIQRP